MKKIRFKLKKLIFNSLRKYFSRNQNHFFSKYPVTTNFPTFVKPLRILLPSGITINREEELEPVKKSKFVPSMTKDILREPLAPLFTMSEEPIGTKYSVFGSVKSIIKGVA